jgi:hypothetical protein
MPVFTEDKRTHDTKAVDNVQALVQLLRNRSYEEIRQRMYDSAPGSPWWSACKATNDVADLLRKTEEAGRRLEIAVYVAIGVSLVQFFNLIFEVFRKR